MDFLLTGMKNLIQAWTQKLGAERTIKRKQEIKQTGTKEDVDSSDATNYVPMSRNAELFSTKTAADEFFVHFSSVSPTQRKRNDHSDNKREENVSLQILHKVALSCLHYSSRLLNFRSWIEDWGLSDFSIDETMCNYRFLQVWMVLDSYFKASTHQGAYLKVKMSGINE